MKPRIGLNCDIEGGARPRATVPLGYIDVVARAGADPVILPVTASPEDIVRECDALLFIGGDDYAIANVEGVPHDFTAVDPRRERFDLSLARTALERDLPSLGICCGFQLLVLAAGGSLHGDLPTESPGPIVHKNGQPLDLARHGIDWVEDRLVPLRRGRHDVNSHHHQGVRSLPASWRTLARSEDGLVEAAAGPGRFQLGVQWHPERDPESEVTETLLRAFVEAAGR